MRFVCDVMLGKLAKYLRLLGFDAAYPRSLRGLKQSANEADPPYFLTRRKTPVSYRNTIYLNSEHVYDQLAELKSLIKPNIDKGRALNRCIVCNVELKPADRSEIEHLVPEFVFHHYTHFKSCPACGKVYWEGSHAEKMSKLVEEIMA